MVSTLLDELPCLIDEADELMARLSSDMTLFKSNGKGTVFASTASDENASTNQDVIVHYSREDFKQPPSPRHSSASTQSYGRARSTADIRQTLETIDIEAILKFFARQFLTMQSMTFEKMNSNLPAGNTERNALYAIATSVYHLMKRLHHWQQAVWESLARFFADNSSSESSLLTFDSHPQLTRLVLATVCKYIKVNLLWTSFSVIPGLLSLYSFLHHVQTTGESATTQYSPLESTDHRVREFVLHFGTAPLLAIQHDFQAQVADKGSSLAALALSCFERYEACHDLAKLRHQGAFDLEALVSGIYASHSSLPDLLNAADIADWVICVVLCVPHQLQRVDEKNPLSLRSMPASPTSPSSPSSPANSSSFLQLWDFMELIARDRLVFTLHRNHVVNLHNLLYHQVTSSLSTSALTTGTTSTSITSFGSNRPSALMKKAMTALSKHALRNSGVNHRQRRELATWLLQNCLQLMKHNPGLIAPSFPLLLAALSIARDEIEWLLCHGVYHSSCKAPLLPGHVKAKHLQRVLLSFSGAERELVELSALSHALRGIISEHTHLLGEYYQTFLMEGDADGIAYTIEELFAAIEPSPSTATIQPLLEGFLDKRRYQVNNSSSTRVTWVREWRQANAHLIIAMQVPLLDILRSRMECAVRHTQYICVHSQLLEHAANFSKCWWFRDIVFENCFDQTVTTSPSSSIGLLDILSSIAAGSYILDELVDTEEAAQYSERMLHMMDRMRASLVLQVEIGLEATVKRNVSLQRDEVDESTEEKPEVVEVKIATSRKLPSFSRVQSSQVYRPSNAELRLASPTAVTSSVLTRNNESVIANNNATPVGRKRETFVDVDRYLELIYALLDHIAQHPYGRILKSAIVDRIRACFIRFLRDFVVFSTGIIDAAALQCSMKSACEQIQCFLSVAQVLFGGANCGSGGDDKVSLGEAVQVVLTKALEAECDALASVLPQDKRLLEWTIETPRVAQTELQAWPLVDRIAWLFISLVTRRCHPSLSLSVALPPVLASVRKKCFVLTPALSGEVDPRDYTDNDALEHLVELVGSGGVESICLTVSNLVVAQTLKLRSSIEAEHAVLAFMDMALSNGTSTDVMLASAQVRTLDDIATQLIQIGIAVFLLQLLHDHSSDAMKGAWETRIAPRILRELQQDPDRRATWSRLLPVACCSAFHTSVWKRTTYLPSLAATDTNAHMMGLAIARLLPPPHNSPSVHRCAVTALKRASACTTQSSSGGSSRSKLQLQVDTSSSESPAQPLLEAIQLMVTTAASGAGESMNPQGSALGELELVIERLLPRAVLTMNSAA
ncbi:unnamed protein product [Phytophthora fragariaefolia]|uniref:Unnamed protein product n=1 Tax=Phytophthora fragariaefolia TaxID=1490495 RepID=A0A9W6XG02_9STRA|nr:unnamed protein product [Phytophthora fragariaefolia]